MAVCCHAAEYGSCRDAVWLFAVMLQSMAAAAMQCGYLLSCCRVWQLQGCGVAAMLESMATHHQLHLSMVNVSF